MNVGERPSAGRWQLTPDYSISRIINGGWQLSQGHGRHPIDREAVIEALFELQEAGFTTFDCADIYTGVEALYGSFLRRYRESSGDRELRGVQIHTKCVPDLEALPHLTRQDVEAIIDRSLRRLGVERLDLVQFHWWDYQVPGYVDAAGWLAEMQRAGKIRLLGATNFDVPRLAEIAGAGIDLALLQVQYSLLDRRPDHGMVRFCTERGIHLLCYGSLAGGFLTAKYLGQAEPELVNRSLTKYRLVIEEAGGWSALQGLLQSLAEVAARHRADVANVASRWVLDLPQVAATIVGARNADHLASNRQVLELELDDEDRGRIRSALRHLQPLAGDPFSVERIPGGPHQRIMKTGLNAKQV
ncbi:MAG: aldo/keto reductase [Acidobacteriota bacterium]